MTTRGLAGLQIQVRLLDVLGGEAKTKQGLMSATSVNLLRAAAEILGGRRALADRLGIGEMLLGRFMADSFELPDPLLLRAVDIILADRQRPPFTPAPAVKTRPASPSDD
jgi:hypothetical protein